MSTIPILEDLNLNYSEILKGRLENVISLPTGLNSNHRGYAVYYANKIWVWTGTNWETWGSGGLSQLPLNTYFVSSGFNNSSPYFTNIDNVMNYLDNNPPLDPVGIIVYSGNYTDNIDIRYPTALYSLGKVQYNSNVVVSSSNLFINGSFHFGRLSFNGATIADINCESIDELNITGSDIQAHIRARQILSINSTFGNSFIDVSEVQAIRLDSAANCKLKANMITAINIAGEAKLSVSGANITAGKVPRSPIITDHGCFLKLENCRVKAEDFPSITVKGIDRLILSNVLLLTDDLYCIDAQSDCRLFLRGSCTINKPNNGNIIRLNQIEDFILEPDAGIENW